MKRLFFLAILMTGVPAAAETSRSASGPEYSQCVAAASAADDAYVAYCDALSPGSRRMRCLTQRDSASRQSWCSVEWSNMPPPKVQTSSEIHVDLENPPIQCFAVGGIGLNSPCCSSPILLDLSGDGFDLTGTEDGVTFDIRGNGTPLRIGWTALFSDDAWLALDRNGNGVIDDGSELFGNYTPQPRSDSPNGFIALAEFDKGRAGGNNDSLISAADRVYSRLRLWQDRNHDGFSTPDELSTLAARGVRALNLDYQVSRLVDAHGNGFRYRGRVHRTPGSHVGPFAYDVFLVTASSSFTTNGPGCTPPNPNPLPWKAFVNCWPFINASPLCRIWWEQPDGSIPTINGEARGVTPDTACDAAITDAKGLLPRVCQDSYDWIVCRATHCAPVYAPYGP
jgi:hypothetical protein